VVFQLTRAGQPGTAGSQDDLQSPPHGGAKVNRLLSNVDVVEDNASQSPVSPRTMWLPTQATRPSVPRVRRFAISPAYENEIRRSIAAPKFVVCNRKTTMVRCALWSRPSSAQRSCALEQCRSLTALRRSAWEAAPEVSKRFFMSRIPLECTDEADWSPRHDGGLIRQKPRSGRPVPWNG
jgi:hypothetical protein